MYRHSLIATLEIDIRSSNAPPDVLRRLDAHPQVFSWRNRVGCLHPGSRGGCADRYGPRLDSMAIYLMHFSRLLKMRRVEGTLSKGWMKISGGARTFLRVPGKSRMYIYIYITNDSTDLESERHQIRIVMAEMIHFIRQMQVYCYLEVIEVRSPRDSSRCHQATYARCRKSKSRF